MRSDHRPIPPKAIRRFERVEGIPLPVIEELFLRMQLKWLRVLLISITPCKIWRNLVLLCAAISCT
jgi:hypothetical protein